MRFLLDTNVISELVTKKPSPKVVSWIKEQKEDDLFISALTIGEIKRGVELLEDGSKKTKLKLWLENDLTERFSGKILDIDTKVCLSWGMLSAKLKKQNKTPAAIDSLIAATAKTHDMILATRNEKNFRIFEVDLVNPWDESAL